MRLRKFRVRAYRCIHDSGEITVGDLAAFVGRNESGKTTILQALTLLNRDERVSELDLCDELSEELKGEIKLVEGEFELNSDEIRLLKQSFPGLPEMRKIKLFRTNKKPKVQYEFEDIQISEERNRELNSWENFANQILSFLDTIPNHLRIQIDTKLFEGPPPKNQEVFDSGMAEFSNQFHVIAVQEPKVIEEWEKIYESPENQFSKLLSGESEKSALENFIAAELDLKALDEVKGTPSKCIKILNTASNRLTKKLNPAWKGDPIHVDLRYNPGNIM